MANPEPSDTANSQDRKKSLSDLLVPALAGTLAVLGLIALDVLSALASIANDHLSDENWEILVKLALMLVIFICVAGKFVLTAFGIAPFVLALFGASLMAFSLYRAIRGADRSDRGSEKPPLQLLATGLLICLAAGGLFLVADLPVAATVRHWLR